MHLLRRSCINQIVGQMQERQVRQPEWSSNISQDCSACSWLCCYIYRPHWFSICKAEDEREQFAAFSSVKLWSECSVGSCVRGLLEMFSSRSLRERITNPYDGAEWHDKCQSVIFLIVTTTMAWSYVSRTISEEYCWDWFMLVYWIMRSWENFVSSNSRLALSIRNYTLISDAVYLSQAKQLLCRLNLVSSLGYCS